MRPLRAWVVAASPERGLVGGPPELLAADDACQVLFDGRLDNRRELEEELSLAPNLHRPDAEVVLAGFHRWGEHLPGRVKGVYSLLAWDKRERTIDAVRDPLGIHSLFRSGDSATTVVSNSLTALAGDGRVALEPSPVALAGLIANRLSHHEETFFTDVYRVPQGHVWRCHSDGRSVLRRHWDPWPTGRPITWAGPDELDQFDTLLENAVARALPAGDAAIYLSGGIDSVSVAAYAADQLGGRDGELRAFSLAFPHPDANEEDVQRAVAAQLGLPHVVMPLDNAVGPEGVLGAALALAADWPVPLLNAWLPGYLRLGAEAVAGGCNGILTGHGGDEWLGTSPYYVADLLRRLQVRKLAEVAGTHRRSYHHSHLRVAYNVLWRFGLRPLLSDGVRPLLARYAEPLERARFERRVPPWLAPAPALRSALFERPAPTHRPPTGGSLYARELRLGLEHPIVDTELEEIFETGLRLGLPVSMPFLDSDLVELLYRVHPEDLSRGGRSKGLVRDTVARRFPQCGFETQRKVLSVRYFRDLLLREAPALRRRLGRVTALADLGVVDPKGVEATLDRLAAGADGWQVQWIWTILSLESWARAQLRREGERR